MQSPSVVACWLSLFVAFFVSSAAPAAAQPEPSGKHPRILLDAELKKAWKASAQDRKSPVARAVRRCDQLTASPAEFGRAGYMSLDWAHHLQACLVAYATTGKDGHAGTVMRYFTAMIDDLDRIGDGKGGDQAARRDSGYAIRAMGPYTALAYDWLHDHPLMTEELRRRARQRFAAWMAWHLPNGYRARSPATNYQAGYLMAATMIAIAQGGEAGKDGTALWRHVVDDLWKNDMAKAFAAGGVLDGGDWAEGWQYGPLSVAHYSLAARVIRRHGVDLPAVGPWVADLLRRHVYALSVDDRLFVGGDTQTEEPYIEPFVFGLAAIALSDVAPPETRGYAIAEMDRLGLESNEFLLFDALARGEGKRAVPVPRESWPTWFVARGTSTLHTRSRWDRSAVWMVAQCSKTLDVDHFQPNAGNFVLSRGKDHLIVDPSPYGSLSTLTGNAPTVDSVNLPDNYRPSQAYWSESTGFRWAHQTARGVVIARCEYSDQYTLQQKKSDVPLAMRDFVLVPAADGTSAALVIADRVDTTSAERKLFLRFRSQAAWKLDDGGASFKQGGSGLVLTSFDTKGGKPELTKPALRDCFKDSVTRGNCDAARFPVVDYRLTLPGPALAVTHVFEASDASILSGKRARKPSQVTGPGYRGVVVPNGDSDAVVVWATKPGKVVLSTKPGTTLIVHDAVPAGRSAAITGKRAGADCELTIQAAGKGPEAALVAFVKADCTTDVDGQATAPAATAPVTAPATPATPTTPADPIKPDVVAAAEPAAGASQESETSAPPRSPRPGCCGASASAATALPNILWVLLALWWRRRRRAR